MNSFTHFKLRYNLGSPRKLLALLLAASMLPAVFFSGSNNISAAPEGAGGGSISGYLIITVDDPAELSEDASGGEHLAAPEDSRFETPAEAPAEDFDEYPAGPPEDEISSGAPENPTDVADYTSDTSADAEIGGGEAAPEDPALSTAGDTPAAADAADSIEIFARETILADDTIALPEPAPAVYEREEDYREEEYQTSEPEPTPDTEPSDPTATGAPPEGPAPSAAADAALGADAADVPAISPLTGHTLYLYFADESTAPVGTSLLDADGKYTFTGLDPGIYKVGLPLLAEDGTLYQLASGDAGGAFETEQGSEPPMAFSRALEITLGALEIENVSARLKIAQEPPETMPPEEMLMESEAVNILSASAPIDLSHDYGGTGSGTGYTITGASPYQALTVTSDAGGPYTIIQSDYDSCLFRNIAVNNGVTTQITIVGINMKTPDNAQGTPPFALQGTANVELFIENAADGSHNKLEHSYTNSSSANNAALYVPTGATLTIDGSGKLETTGGRSGAGIGGGTTTASNASAGTITIKGGTVEANGGFYAAGIGGSDSGKSGKITIEGGIVTATGGFHGAGIGFGSSGGAIYPGNDNDSFNSITITDGHVEATGGQYSAGIGGGYSCAGGRTTITGGVIVATGGDGSAGAGIGGGYSGRGGFITISGDADITATGGSSGLDGSYEAPGIGGAGDGANNTYLTLDHTATVKAYAASPLASISRPAIYTGDDAISGTGYFVNAYFPSETTLPNGGDIRLDVYANGGSVKTNTLILPPRVNAAHTTYRGFAYTTGADYWQSDRIQAYAADGSSLGSVVRNDDSSPGIRSYNDKTYLQVKLGGPIPGTLTVDNIGKTSAVFTGSGFSLNGFTFSGGGFRYSTNPDMSDAVDMPWGISPFPTGNVVRTVNGLEPDTVYYAQIFLSTTFAGGGALSAIVSFKTKPDVIDLSETKENGTGYTVSGSPSKQTLTINSSAGSPYTIIQSGGNDPGASIFQNIVVAGGITVTITIREINVLCETDNTPVFSVRSSSSAQTSVTLLLDGENTLTQSATGAGNNAALSVSRPNELNFNYTAILAVNTVPEGGGSLTATGGAGGAGIGGGDSGRSGQININGGDITAIGGAGTDGGAGIGSNGGYLNGDNHITVSGGIVSATGGAGSVNGGAGIGAGGNGNVSQGSAGINGTAKVVATGGTGVSGGAGIGSGGSSRAGGGSAGSLGVSGSAKVTALGGAGTSYGGAGFGAGGNGGGGSSIQAYGSAELTAKGGAGINGGAGVGGGGTDPAYPYIGAGGSVYITGTAKVVATGGIGSASSGAGIGGGGGSGAGISGDGRASLSLASTATVKAYSHSADHPAIQASYNFGGNGYYVNAYFAENEEPSVLTGAATKLEAAENDNSFAETVTLELPHTYRSFAYTTNNTAEQSDSIWAVNTANDLPLGFVTLYDSGSPLISSVKNPGTLQRVKLSSEPGTPSVTNIQKDGTGVTSRADFTSTGHSLLYGATLNEGGFRYSKSRNSETGTLTGSVDTKAWAEQTAASPKTETVASLEPNTRYYMATYLNTTIMSGAQNLTSASVQFATLPYIESASASEAADDGTAALISADFYESTATNIAIDKVTLYWDTAPIDAGSPETAAHSETLAPEAYGTSGFTGYKLEGLTVDTAYNLLLVIENESGIDSRAFTHAPAEINVSVPVKLIFAAFDTDGGDVTAPVYHIKNNGKNTASVTVDGFDEIDGDELTLTKYPPGVDELRLKLEGTGASLGTGMADYLEISASINAPLCTLQSSGIAGDTYYFTLSGSYNGAFSTVRRPEYFLILKFGLA